MHYLALRNASILAAVLAPLALAQSTGSIQGHVVGDDGKPISGARVYAAVKAPSQQIPAPPTLATTIGNAVNASPDGSFTIPNLGPAPYILCAQTTVSGWLDPCQWAVVVPFINLASGQILTGQNIVMTKGVIVQIRVNDPQKLLPPSASAVAHDVEVMALGSNKAYYHSRIVSSDPAGRTHEITLPFGAAHNLIVRSQQFALADAKGAAVSAADGHTEPVQVANGHASPPLIFTVTGKSK